MASNHLKDLSRALIHFILGGALLVFLVASFLQDPSPPGTFHQAADPTAFLSSLQLPGRRFGDRPKKQEGSNGGQEHLAGCNLFDGRWVLDEEALPSYEPGTCPFIDEAFDCHKNGRLDSDYTKLRWKPNGCTLPRLEGREMLEMLRGKRLAFVGDSLNRNMWESLVCILRASLPDKNRVFEISRKRQFRTEGFYSFQFIDYNCTVEFFRSTFLVQQWETFGPNGTLKETLRLDLMDQSSAKFRNADMLVFNTGHWWTHEKTAEGKDYYQEGDHIYSKLDSSEAFEKALSTWGRWLDAAIDRNHSRVFFRGYSASHFSGGPWNYGGNCDGERLPITNDSSVSHYPKLMQIFESVMQKTATPISYINITRLTSYRKDAHPSVFYKPIAQRRPGDFQDCSHWCLPGVPDAWNEILYAMLLQGLHHNSSTVQKADNMSMSEK